MRGALLQVATLAAAASLLSGFYARVPLPPPPRWLVEEKYQCTSCHSLGGYGGMNGPPLDAAGEKYRRLKGSARAARAWFLQHLEDPRTWPGVGNERYSHVEMPIYRFDPGDREAIADYLLTLRQAPR
ncbi:MAG: cytochrome c [Planctomycetes bacterium]|nr:cytochrome c [Planctomycetota bacterium]